MLEWWRFAIETSQMVFEAQQVVVLRLEKMGRLDFAASVEAQKMVAEKAMALGEAVLSAATAASLNGDARSVAAAFVRPYRKRVRANRRRLARRR